MLMIDGDGGVLGVFEGSVVQFAAPEGGASGMGMRKRYTKDNARRREVCVRWRVCTMECGYGGVWKLERNITEYDIHIDSYRF